MLRTALPFACLCAIVAAPAAAQDQTIIVDQPLAACTALKTAALSPADAAAVISSALAIKEPAKDTYYIVHSTEFTPGRNTVAEEHWYVYYAGWDEHPSPLRWLADSRQAKRFKEARIMGSEKVSLVYVYVNVPAHRLLSSRNDIVAHYRKQHQADKSTPEERAALEQRIRASLTTTAEQNAVAAAVKAVSDAAAANKTDPKTSLLDPDVERIVQLETERYLRSFGDGVNKAITDEIQFVDQNTGEALVGLSPTLATNTTFSALNSLFYKIAVTKKTPAPIENLKAATKFAFSGQADAATPIYVDVPNISVCAGGNMSVKHVPSDLLVTAFNKNAKDEEVQRSKQQFDNEGKYWWDISFAVPLESHNDLKIDVDAGQVAAKQVEKTDLFAVVNLGPRRDTKKLQWQLIPNFIYGMPITAQPLKHQLIGFSIGLNYVQLIGGWRFDRRTEVATGEQNGTPVGVEGTPPGDDHWEDANWTWALNIPVQTIIKLFQKDAKK